MNILDAKHIFSYRKYWAHRFGSAPELPMTRAEMDELGWDSCDIIIVTGDAYIDHPSFGMAGDEGFGTVMQGYLEKSNVDVVKEMINLIVAQRSYEINSKAVKTADEMLAMTNALKR